MNNLLLAATLAAASIYVTVGVLVPAPLVSIAISTALLIVGAAALWRYGPPAFDVVYHGQRGSDPGAHLAVYGMALLAAGSVYSGAYGIVWNVLGQPDAWLGSWFSASGRALTTGGFVLMVFAPEAVKPRIRVPNLIILSAIMSAAFVTVFLLGTQVS